MNQKTIFKSLAVVIILLFIGLGVQPAIAVKSDYTDNGEGPDLKCLKLKIKIDIGLSGIPYVDVKCSVINIGDNYSGKMNIVYRAWDRVLVVYDDLGGGNYTKNVNWENGEIKNFDICELIYHPILTPGFYRFKFNINIEGDKNPKNNGFDRHFFFSLFRFYPTRINL